MTNPKQNTPGTPPAFTHDELVIINNALNEVCHGLSLDDEEFQTRIGYSRAMAQSVLKKVAKALGK
ncbi:MAG TPA: hypothetical protein VG099_24175 [Gemmataceae bacterium]|jgi:hypothetical protein|nr:hypothetical protein [Gemmataceae bacterium]